jgi:hypothetical protein
MALDSIAKPALERLEDSVDLCRIRLICGAVAAPDGDPAGFGTLQILGWKSGGLMADC